MNNRSAINVCEIVAVTSTSRVVDTTEIVRSAFTTRVIQLYLGSGAYITHQHRKDSRKVSVVGEAHGRV